MIDLRQAIQQEATTLTALFDKAGLTDWHKVTIIKFQAKILLDLLMQAGMYDPSIETNVDDATRVLPDIAGKFIAIPAFSAAGRVQKVQWTNVGGKQVIEVLLRERPTDPASEWKTFYLKPTMYEVIRS